MQLIKDSIVNAVCFISTSFIICVVTDNNQLIDPVKVWNTPELLQFAIHKYVFVSGRPLQGPGFASVHARKIHPKFPFQPKANVKSA